MPTPNPSKTAPYRADHVGSLLRPLSVKQARVDCLETGSKNRSHLKAVEDEAIRDAVRMQQDCGLLAVTDGEYRRSFWHYDFMGALSGFELVTRSEGVKFAGKTLPPVFPTITGLIDFPDSHPMLDHYRFLASVSDAEPKISIPGPSCCHFRTARTDIAPREYEDVDYLFADIAGAYAKAVSAFYDAGCRYLQLDDIFFAYLCDPKHRADKVAEGYDPDELITAYAKMIARAIDDRPDDMVVAMHLCRGNFRSTHAAAGGYESVADAVFNQTSVDIYFMEYDSERAGGLEPLALLPRGNKRVLPGFVTTKRGELESVDDLCRKFDAAAKHVDLGQLGIAPQCGFASTEHGNELTEDDQRRKLELVVATAEAIWGGVNA